jgi:hypothetical protein
MAITITRVESAISETPSVAGPLKALEEYAGLSILRYPEDLAPISKSGKNNKNHWVTFTIKDIDPAEIGSGNTAQNPTVIVTNSGTGGAVLTGAATALGTGNALEGLKTGVTAGIINALIPSKGLSISPQTKEVKSVISLYMPDTLTSSYDANYEEMSLASDLGTLLPTLRAIGSAGEGNEGLIQSILEGKGNQLGSDPSVISAATGLLQTGGIDIPGVDVANLGTLLQRAEGYAINPQVQMIYRGTNLRSFNLDFTLTPKSQSEAARINDIIQQFRFYSLPTLGQKIGNVTNSTTNSMYLIPPSIFNIQFYVNGVESPYLAKYGDCILESVQVNQAPNGFAVFRDGSMVQTQLSLSFREMNILTRDNINDSDTSAQRR